MKRRLQLGLAVSAVAFCACGGAFVSGPSEDGGTTVGDSGTSKDATAASDARAPDAGFAIDAATRDAALVDSYVADTYVADTYVAPPAIICGAKLCAPGQYCCLAQDSSGNGSCIAEGAFCGSTLIKCNDQSDCTDGNLCCAFYNGNGDLYHVSQVICSNDCFQLDAAVPHMCDRSSPSVAQECGVQQCLPIGNTSLSTQYAACAN